jgi:hypothetical protein
MSRWDAINKGAQSAANGFNAVFIPTTYFKCFFTFWIDVGNVQPIAATFIINAARPCAV